MLEIKNYQLIKISSSRNFKRICNEILKTEYVKSVSIENSNNMMHVEYDLEKVTNDEILLKAEELILKAIREYEKKAIIVKADVQEKFRKVLYLRNIDCAHCASRIESIARKTIENEKIILDYTTGRFIIETYNKAVIETLYSTISRIARHVDDRIVVVENKKEKLPDETENKKVSLKRLIPFGIGIILFVALLITNEFLYIDDYYYVVPYVLVGYPVILRFFKNIINRSFLDETFLMTIASIGAFFTNHPSEAVMVVALYQIGELLQNKAINKSRKSIKALLDIDVKTAKLKLQNEVTEVDVESIMPGDIVIVSKGEIVPADGVIVSGKTNIDTKNLTGESMLRSVDVGDPVLSGSVNMSKIIEVKVSKPYTESTMSKILDLVENATSSKAKTENVISKFARYYTPIVVGIAIVIIIFGSVLDLANLRYWIHLSMEFLVISCPCALVISVPLCYFSAIGTASRRGILVKGSNYIEALSNVDNIVFDKTGTVTKGVFTVTNVVSLDETISKERLLNILLHTEYYSNHPIGISIVDNHGREKIFPEIISEFQDVTGGAKATVNGNKILIGNEKLMHANKIEGDKVESDNLVIYVVMNKTYIGYVEIGDIIKEEAKDVIKELKENNKHCYMLTGDAATIAKSVATTIDVDGFHAELLPHQKVEMLEEIKTTTKGKTMFIGDGINDAPVIASADVGVAMGNAGSDATIAIADVVIMGDNLSKINEALKIAKYTKRKVTQNIVISLLVKFVVMLIAVVMGFIVNSDGSRMELPLAVAIFSDVGISLLAILNSLLIMRLYHKDKSEVKKDEE